jgi:hypothetical protein
LYDRPNEDDDTANDNTLIQLFNAPHEQTNVSVSFTTSTADPATFVWGGYDSNGLLRSPGWTWGSGATWLSFIANPTADLNELTQVSISFTTTNITPSSLMWGGYDTNNNWVNAGWTWGNGGAWS